MSTSSKPKCPRCKTSAYVVPAPYGERLGTGLSGLVGLGLTISEGITTGAKAGAVASAIIPHPVVKLAATAGGATAGGVLSAVTAFLTWSAVGGKIGAEIDNRVIRRYKCNRCNKTINA